MAVQTPNEVTVDAEAIQGFTSGLRGPVLAPGDVGYEEARRIWNGLIDRRPR